MRVAVSVIVNILVILPYLMVSVFKANNKLAIVVEKYIIYRSRNNKEKYAIFKIVLIYEVNFRFHKRVMVHLVCIRSLTFSLYYILI